MKKLFSPIRRLYDWTLHLARHRHAGWALFGISFAESSFFPIPPDVMLIPMCVANRAKAFTYAAICSLASVLGGVAGYAIGYFVFEAIGQPILDFYGLTAQMDAFRAKYDAMGGWIIAIAGFTPLPYKLITIASGLFQYAFLPFIILSALSRSARFFLVATLIWKYGAPIQNYIEKRFEWMTILFTVLLLGGFLAIKTLL